MIWNVVKLFGKLTDDHDHDRSRQKKNILVYVLRLIDFYETKKN